MKNLGLLLLSVLTISCNEVSMVEIENLQVMKEDLGEMNWYDAREACARVGEGWRLPTIDELQMICQYKDSIGGFKTNEKVSYYFSCSDYEMYDEFDAVEIVGFGFIDECEVVGDEKGGEDYGDEWHVRAVRSADFSFVEIDNIKVMTKDLGQMNWDDAVKKCRELGYGWRLPNDEEAKILQENKENIGGFSSDDWYWTSVEHEHYDEFDRYEDDGLMDADIFCCMPDCRGGSVGPGASKNEKLLVRAVKTELIPEDYK